MMRVSELLKDPWPGLFRCRVLLGFFLVVSLAIFSTGLSLVLQHRAYFVHSLAPQMPLRRTASLTFPFFENPRHDDSMMFYFFNITNPFEVQAGLKPVLRQLGPYFFNVDRKKEQIQFKNDSDVVFIERTFLFFDAEKSSGDYETDLLVTIDDSSNTPKIHIRPVADFLPPVNKNGTSLLEFNANDTAKLNSSTNRFIVDTGARELARIYSVKSYNNHTRFDHVWPQSTVDNKTLHHDFNIVRGKFPGSGFHPELSTNSLLSFFVSTTCLPIKFNYASSSTYGEMETMLFKHDIPLWMRHTEMFNRELCYQGQNSTDDANNATSSDCWHHGGILNATKCPLSHYPIVSMPHFLHASPSLQENFFGLNANSLRHDSFIEVDAVTGLSLSAIIRLQYNMAVRLENGTSSKMVIFPIMWTEEAIIMTSEGLVSLQQAFYSSFRLFKLCAYAVLISGTVMLPLLIIIYFTCKSQHYDRKVIQPPAILVSVTNNSSQVQDNNSNNNDNNDENNNANANRQDQQVELNSNSEYFTAYEPELSSYSQYATPQVSRENRIKS